MPKVILAYKVNMSRTFREDGTMVPVTVLKAGPCVVTQVKDEAKNGYRAVQVGFGEVKAPASKARAGHLKAVGKNLRHLKEFRVTEGEFVVGQVLDVTQFAPGDVVDVVGTSKGRGFQGVVKRHGFHGHPASHGHKDQARMPGSIGAGGVQHVRKGMRMAGRMGGARVTAQNLTVVEVHPEQNELWLKGAVPGAPRGLLVIRTA
ncbi:MAG: 50S ribosomal protein L3 [Candidatus Veblenbacteria bacterium]|nr:50S ribosomal protein L3 [Candidatus Veblenbacteria bacterium]MDZ4230090.1 50S ribosomal protein L3 [Candidatus Veblenbacteria bacterium]